MCEPDFVRADGVFSGGGIKGLAFAGGLQAAAEAGYDEWVKLAGTSAGAITAMALAVGYSAQGLREQLDDFDFAKIADYGPLGELEIPANLLHHGATKGKALHAWIEKLLADAPQPARTFGDLEADKLRVVGADLAHSRMVVFPGDVELYIDEHGKQLAPDDFPIADAVRISAGYPYFFPPLSLIDGHTKKPGVLVDGGVTSAFPVFLFDKPQPEHPTWGFRLFGGKTPEQPSYTAIDGPLWPIDMLKAIVDTSMNALDKLEMVAFAPRTISIPTGDVPTLDFELSAAQKKELYDSGYDTAKAFFDRKPDGRNTFGATPAA
ncbi:MAG TPA: patatin-like phospholipase family protein [Solirubrobacteraceae bacterium]|nr:patatin-like phospholipase family protein [Solirubrobacteraceae bacterium]